MSLIKIIDAELLFNKKHRFPNLACMKLSQYFINQGNSTELVESYESLENFDRLYISKVFTETKVPESLLEKENVFFGGTGFFYDKAPPLPFDIEHTKPDYHLYDTWVAHRLQEGIKPRELKYYTDYSIGFSTRGCFRKCGFCVNKNYNKVVSHSPVMEFLDDSRSKICLLDDNILGYKDWKAIVLDLIKTNKKFQFKQGLDKRILDNEKSSLLSSCKYDDDYIFAFDNIEDKSLIEEKLILWKTYNLSKGQNTKLYLFCGFDRNNLYDMNFWKQDIIDLFDRIKILMKYNCKPYVMRYLKYEDSPYRGIYINIAQWCNQPSLFNGFSYNELCEKDNERKGGNSATKRYNDIFRSDNPVLAESYFNLKLKDEVKKNESVN